MSAHGYPVKARDAILACRPAIGVIGRRTRRTLIGDYAAIADFGLHVATICGDPAPGIPLDEVAKIDVTTFLFKHTVFSGKATSVMGDPLNAVAWLAAELAAKGRQLEPNDVVATGSCSKILQVWAGQQPTSVRLAKSSASLPDAHRGLAPALNVKNQIERYLQRITRLGSTQGPRYQCIVDFLGVTLHRCFQPFADGVIREVSVLSIKCV